MELRGWSKAELAEAAAGLGLKPGDTAGIALALAKEARPGKADVAPEEKPSDYTPEKSAELEAKGDEILLKAILEAEAMPESAFNLGRVKTASGETAWRIPENGSTIIFSEIADFLAKGIKAGWSKAEAMSQAVAKWGKGIADAAAEIWNDVLEAFGADVQARFQRDFDRDQAARNILAEAAGEDGISQYGMADRLEGEGIDSATAALMRRRMGVSERQAANLTRLHIREKQLERDGKLDSDEMIEEIQASLAGGLSSKFLDAVGKEWDNSLSPIYKQLGDVWPGLERGFKAMLYRKYSLNRDGFGALKPLIEGLRKLDADDSREWKLVAEIPELRNDFLARHPELAEPYKAWRAVAREFLQKAREAGMNIGEAAVVNGESEYFPTWMEDYKGFLDSIDRLEDSGPISKAIIESGAIYPHQKMDAVMRAINGGFGHGPRASFIKGRKITDRSVEGMKHIIDFYGRPEIALEKYVERMAHEITTQEYLGADYLSKTRKRQAGLRSGSGEDVSLPEDLLTAVHPASRIGQEILDAKEAGKLGRENELKVRELLNVYANTEPFTAKARIASAFNMVFALREIASNVTQLATIPVHFAENGLLQGLDGINPFSKYNVKLSDLGLAELFTIHAKDQGQWAKRLQSISATLGGLKPLDAVEAAMRLTSNHSKLSRLAQAEDKTAIREIVEPYSRYLSKPPDEVIQDLANANRTEDVNLLLFSDLAHIRPVDVASFAPRWHKSGSFLNRTMLYGMRTWSAFNLDRIKRDTLGEIAKGNAKEGLLNFAKIVPAMVLGGAATSQVASWLSGMPTNFSDQMLDSMFRMFFWSSYLNEKSQREGLTGVMDSLLNPTTPLVEGAWKLASMLYSAKDAGKRGDSVWRHLADQNFIGELPVPNTRTIARLLSPGWIESSKIESQRDRRLKEMVITGRSDELRKEYYFMSGLGEKKRKELGHEKRFKELGRYNKLHDAALKMISEHSRRKEYTMAENVGLWLDLQAGSSPALWRQAEAEAKASMRMMKNDGYFKED